MEDYGSEGINSICRGPAGHCEPLFVLGVILVILFVAIPILIIKIVAWWKICTKAGLSGWLSLIMLIPGSGLFLPLIVAFVDWPALRTLATAQQQPPATPPVV